MNPFFFGTSERRLFGLYTPGHAREAAPRAVVLCYPWGQEYLRSHRSMRHLATLLNRRGVHVLRFDYFGTGDSAGESGEGEPAGWESDIETAVEELKDTAGVSAVGLVGLRLGATLAAAVAARRHDIDTLVLWDPIVTGDEYLQEIARLSGEGSPGTPAPSREIHGFVLTDRLERSLRSIDLLAHLPTPPRRTLAVATQPLPSHPALQTALSERTGSVLETMPTPPAWFEDANTGVGATPVKVLERIAQWWGSRR
jgi:alpha/beta superfamily hydrolase